ncbi:MAG: SDR family oxidoreductase [Bacteroidia bacterium]|nr:SDR family oxidoreductase [Bacteroidia bacterium]
MNRKKIFITGATGLLGSHLLAELLCRDLEIHALYRNEKAFEELKKVLSHFGVDHKFSEIHWQKGGLHDILLLRNWITDNSIVIHGAGFVSFMPHDKEKLHEINVRGTAGVVNACLEKKGVRLCHISSIAVFNPEEKKSFITESDFKSPPAESGPYHVSKYFAETEVWRGAEEGLEVVVANPGLIISGFYAGQSSGNLIEKGKKLSLFYPKGTTGMIFAYDCAKAIAEIALSEIKNERFILIEGNYSYKELFRALKPNGWMLPAPYALLMFTATLNEILHKIFRLPLFISRQMVKSASTVMLYSNEKFKKHFPHFAFQKLCTENLKKNGIL